MKWQINLLYHLFAVVVPLENSVMKMINLRQPHALGFGKSGLKVKWKMSYNFKLELKAEHVQGEKDLTFYKYRYETCTFWFSQNRTNGNIYRVNISDEQYCDVEYYSDDTEDRFYPTNIRVVIPRFVVKNDNDYTELNKKVQYCCSRRYAIENFLLSGDHYRLWVEKHEKDIEPIC